MDTVFSYPDFPGHVPNSPCGVAVPFGCDDAEAHPDHTPTVGSGVGPDLLTFRIAKALAGSCGEPHLPPVGNFTPP